MMLECAQMLADEGFMFHLTPENIQIRQMFVPLFERLTTEGFYLRLRFTR
jgi:hypothetical protein